MDLSLWTQGELYLHARNTDGFIPTPTGHVRAAPGAKWWGVLEGTRQKPELSRMLAKKLNADGWSVSGSHYVAVDAAAWEKMQAHQQAVQDEWDRKRRAEFERERKRLQDWLQPAEVFDVEECRLMLQRYHPDKPTGDREKFERWQRRLAQAKEAMA